MAIATIGLSTHIWNNNLRSLILLAVYPFLMLAIIWSVCAAIGITLNRFEADPGFVGLEKGTVWANQFMATYWPSVMAVVSIWFFIAYFFHAKMLRMLSHAKSVSREEEPKLYNLLENLCISRGIDVPRLEIIETEARNAFASGIDRRSFAITVTRGLMEALQDDELEAVLAHELTHIINRDVRLLIISIIFTGMIGFAAQLVWSSLRYRLWTGGGRGGGKRDARILILIMLIALILWLGYMATMFTRLALSRRREYLADAGAVELTKNPDAMMRALLRISANDHIAEATDDVSMMCTANSHRFLGVFLTHPPIEERLKAIADTMNIPIPTLEAEKDKNPWDR